MTAAKIHFLHIGKTGGSALKAALAPVARERGLVFHPHATRLVDVPPAEPVCVTLREPVTRFVSAFNSRLRMGRPKNNVVWNEGEAIAFARFGQPDQLAVALSSDDRELRDAATFAMNNIRHVARPQTYWISTVAEVVERGDALVLFQERLPSDFEQLKAHHGFPPDLRLPSDPVAAHATPPGFATTLSAEGRRNVEAWYADDLELYRQARERFCA